MATSARSAAAQSARSPSTARSIARSCKRRASTSIASRSIRIGLPNTDIRITEEFLEEHADLLLGAAKSLAFAAFETPGAVDRDVHDALEALIRTRRTLQSGVYYETRPDNVLANRIFSGTRSRPGRFRAKRDARNWA